MTDEELKNANELDEKIKELKWFLECSMHNRPKRCLKIVNGFRKFIKAESYGMLEQKEYTINDETFGILVECLKHQLSKWELEFEKLGKKEIDI